MKKIIFRVIAVIFIILTLLILTVDIMIAIQSNKNPEEVPGIFGYKPFIVLSGSMKSKINVGDLVVVKNDYKDLKVNDIISFKDSDNIVTTHRIINVINENGKTYYETKGDSNNVKDAFFVYPENIEGIYKFKIPKLGDIILFIQKPIGFFMMIIVILFITGIMFINENHKIVKKEKIKDEQYRKEFEEFKKQKELNKNK